MGYLLFSAFVFMTTLVDDEFLPPRNLDALMDAKSDDPECPSPLEVLNCALLRLAGLAAGLVLTNTEDARLSFDCSLPLGELNRDAPEYKKNLDDGFAYFFGVIKLSCHFLPQYNTIDLPDVSLFWF